jgi:hypothetical protein
MSIKSCSCCGEFTLNGDFEGEVCSICGWAKDHIQEANIHQVNGRNKKSLAEARDIYFAHRHNHSIF